MTYCVCKIKAVGFSIVFMEYNENFKYEKSGHTFKL